MRFKFNGDLDCPDWILAEISVLSRLSSIKMKLFCEEVCQSIYSDKLNLDSCSKHGSTAKLSNEDVNAAAALIIYVLKSSAKFQVEQQALSIELQQLGLPWEHSQSFSKLYNKNRFKILAKLQDEVNSTVQLLNVRWRADCIILSSYNQEDCSLVTLNLNLKGHSRSSVVVTLRKDQICLMLHELIKAKSVLERLESSIK